MKSKTTMTTSVSTHRDTAGTCLTSNGSLLTMYSLATPPELFDIRCEYEVPRFVDFLSIPEDEEYDMYNGVPDGWG